MTFGPAIWPSLVTWPTRRSGGACHLRVADQRLRGSAHLADGAGRRIERVGPECLNGIDDDEIRRLAVAERRQDVRQIGFRGEPDLSVGKTKAGCAQPNLRDRFFAGEIERAAAASRDVRRDLEQKRRFADAGFAADQDRRAGHDATAA